MSAIRAADGRSVISETARSVLRAPHANDGAAHGVVSRVAADRRVLAFDEPFSGTAFWIFPMGRCDQPAVDVEGDTRDQASGDCAAECSH